MPNSQFPKNLSQILTLPWEYYISRNLPIWHNELTLLCFNEEDGFPFFRLPQNYVQLRVHRGAQSDFYYLLEGDLGHHRLTNAALKNFDSHDYVGFLKEEFRARCAEFIKLAKGLRTDDKLMQEFFRFYGRCCCMLDITSMSSKALTRKILELLGDRPDKAEIFAQYSKSTMLSPLQKLERELEHLRGKKIDVAREAKRLHKKYYWIPVSFVGEPWSEEYFRGLVGNNLARTGGESRRSIGEGLSSPVLNEGGPSSSVRDEGLSALLLTKEAKHYLRALGVIAGLNEYRKGVFSQVSLIIRPLLDKLAKQHNLGTWQDINLLTHDEILDLLHGKNDYQKELTEKRGKLCMMYTSSLHKVDFLYGNDVLEFEKKFKPSANGEEEVKGIVANKGKVAGKAKIIFGPADFHKFKTGDILIAKMTSVDFIPIMKKASAFVTDEGGLACHAAIISREYNKPCIVGTGLGTVVFKDGDRVEVDAEKGIVVKLN